MARYYYAGGKRQSLDSVDDRVAIDVRAAHAEGLAVDSLPILSKLSGGMIIVAKKAVSGELLARLTAAGAAQPVYKSGGAFVVLMPEVRVETDAGQHEAAIHALNASHIEADIIDRTPERLSLRPKSGSSEDALDLANYIHEHAHPAASSVRMFQVVPKRSVPE